MTPRIIRSSQVRLEIVKTAEYIGQRNIDAGLRFFDAVEETIGRLAEMPTLAGVWESSEPELAGLRVWPVRGFANYLIFFKPISDGIQVFSVVDGRRDLEQLLRKRSRE